MARKLPGRAIQAGTITVTQLETTVATTVQTGGGPKITNVQVTSNSYVVLDDTAVDIAGGYIKITGTGFVTGCSVIIGTVVATSVSFISSTEVRAQVPAQSAGTYTVYLVNPDGGVGIRVNGLNYSSTPTWTTTSPLGDGVIDTAISVQFVATSNSTVTYALQAGSTLPAGLSLSSSGLLTGTVTGITVDTTYNFTVVATDAENQDTPQAFSITITISDPNFKNTVLLLQADTAPTVISDASTNNFDLTVVGDARASNFTPYGTGWSVFFDGNADYFTVPANAAFAYGTGAFTIEAWVYRTGLGPAIYYGSVILAQAASSNNYVLLSMSGDSNNQITFYLANSLVLTSTNLNFNQWYHIAVVRENTSTNGVKLYVNGSFNVSGTSAANLTDTTLPVSIGDYSHSNILGMNGYISNLRVVKGTAVYTATFTPPTAPLTAITNTSLLTCHANRFLDSSTNNFTITRNGDAKVVSFNPFNITNTGVNGSAYFDGTGDYCAVAANSAFSFPADFTWEAWAYPFGMPNGGYAIIYATGGSGSQDQFGLSPTEIFGAGVAITAPIRINTWMHCVICRQGSIVRYFVNGILAGTSTNSATIGSNANNALIGMRSDSSHAFQGYIADLRIIKGTALYTANFTPPTQPLTAIANTQLLTLQYDQPHNNHTFLDSSSNQFLITRNGNTTQGTFSPFSQSGHSVYFDGTGDYLSLADNEAWTLGSSDFSLEVWIYPTVIPADQYPGVIGHRSSYTVSNGWCISINLANSIAFAYSTSGDGSATQTGIFVSITATELLAKWSHIVVTRSGSQFRMFINGQLRGTLTSSGTIFNSTAPVIIGRLDNSDGNYFTGYISNVRLVKGSIPVEYQTSSTTVSAQIFTPPIQTVTAVSGTQLLACHANRFIDSSSNNFTVTRNGDARVTAFGPFSTTAYSATSNGGSAYFDGSGDYLSVANSTSLQLSNADWTIECWVYVTSTTGNQRIISQSDSNYEFAFYMASGALTAYSFQSAGTQNFAISMGTLVVNQWYHIAATRSGSTIRAFVNGSQTGSATFSGTIDTRTGGWKIGSSYAGTENFSGYISNARIVKGTALYTSAFTVPTAPPSPTANTSLLLNFTDAAMRDSRGLAVLETVGDAKTSTVQVKYGTGSMRFDGTGDRLTVPATPNLTFGTGDFTIEMWINSGTNGGSTRVMGNGAGAVWSANKWVIGAISNFFIAVNNYSNSTSMMTSTTAAGDNTWHHFAVTRSGNVWRLFVDGVQQSTVTSSVSLDGGVAANIDIGRGGISSDADWAGYLDDLRITRGIARYTANFTPPAAKFLTR